ncbi:pentapeptide repeat-containing protein [Candidatus Thiosymbion oneisti]|uniref:pentapeptide repeat-containing protein n=1 Tax=Candidatus Thiosymbion oneisti TaxID=589554 RepID=UPI000AE85C4D|nr:pentapeptide repeat-containing protein [Candidatus Thiosymbion oneisti]
MIRRFPFRILTDHDKHSEIDEMPRNRDQAENPWSLQEGKLPLLRTAADESARHVRGLYFKFLLFAFYVAVIVFSTDDEQLLKGTGADLPLLGVELPLVGFYVVVPWLVLIFHAHLLSQFYLLSRKLFDLDHVLGSLPSESARIQRGLLFPLIFSHRIVGSQHPRLIRWVFGVAVVVTILMTPILLLAAVQYKFLPYHSAWITFNHQLVLTLDLLLLWILWPRLSSRSGRWRDWWSQSRSRWGVWVSTSLGALVSAILTFGAWILLVPHVGDTEEWLAEKWGAKDKEEELAENQPGLPWIHRNLELRERTLMRKNPPVELLASARECFACGEDTKAEEAEAKVWIKDGEALDLRERDLRYADFYKSRLWDADLRGANLQYAKLQGTRLQGADMRPIDRDSVKKHTDLRHAQLEDANLKDAKLQEAQLQGADLEEAQLQIADLTRAQLQGAVLWEAQLQGAVLSGAQLQIADLSWAQLQSADLTRAQLEGADLRWAQLQGAVLQHADLQGADLTRAQLQIAFLQWAKLQGADLTRAQLQIADLQYAGLQGAKLWEAQLQGTDLSGAQLQGTDLSGAQLQGADLRGAQLQIADLRGAQLQGAVLRGAQLQIADLQYADLQGANLREAVVYGTEFQDAELSLADLRDLSLPRDDWEGLSSVFSEIEKLEAKLEQASEHWSQWRREGVERAIERFWSVAFDLPVQPTTISPPEKPDVMHDQQGPFKCWPAPPDKAVFERERADYRAGLACNNRYIAERMWRYARGDGWVNEPVIVFGSKEPDPVLEQALRDKAESGACPVLAEVLEKLSKTGS